MIDQAAVFQSLSVWNLNVMDVMYCPSPSWTGVTLDNTCWLVIISSINSVDNTLVSRWRVKRSPPRIAQHLEHTHTYQSLAVGGACNVNRQWSVCWPHSWHWLTSLCVGLLLSGVKKCKSGSEACHPSHYYVTLSPVYLSQPTPLSYHTSIYSCIINDQ